MARPYGFAFEKNSFISWAQEGGGVTLLLRGLQGGDSVLKTGFDEISRALYRRSRFENASRVACDPQREKSQGETLMKKTLLAGVAMAAARLTLSSLAQAQIRIGVAGPITGRTRPSASS